MSEPSALLTSETPAPRLNVTITREGARRPAWLHPLFGILKELTKRSIFVHHLRQAFDGANADDEDRVCGAVRRAGERIRVFYVGQRPGGTGANQVRRTRSFSRGGLRFGKQADQGRGFGESRWFPTLRPPLVRPHCPPRLWVIWIRSATAKGSRVAWVPKTAARWTCSEG